MMETPGSRPRLMLYFQALLDRETGGYWFMSWSPLGWLSNWRGLWSTGKFVSEKVVLVQEKQSRHWCYQEARGKYCPQVSHFSLLQFWPWGSNFSGPEFAFLYFVAIGHDKWLSSDFRTIIISIFQSSLKLPLIKRESPLIISIMLMIFD